MQDCDRSETLNALLNGELRAAHLYWQAGAWCNDHRLDGCADFLIAHADEELMHMRRLLRFMLDNDCSVAIADHAAPEIGTETVLDLFKLILGHEGKVTEAIGSAVRDAQAAGDHGTFEFLQWFVMEQRGEMKLFRHIVERIELIGEGPHSLYLVDQEVAAIASKAGDTQTAAPVA